MLNILIHLLENNGCLEVQGHKLFDKLYLQMKSPSKNTEVGSQSLVQRIFLMQGLQADSLPSEPPGNPQDICKMFQISK